MTEATHYQYALFSDDSVTCADAQYGEFKTIATHLTEISLGDDGTKIICLRGKDKAGNVQADPERYTWKKVPALSELLPEARLQIPPTSCDTQIDSKVLSNSITKQYQYVLKEDESNFDCDANGVSYETVQTLADNFKLDLGDDGDKTLCLRGLSADGKLKQSQATRYTWKKNQAAEQLAEGETPAAGDAGLGLFCETFTLHSGIDEGRGVTVKNIGSGTLQWRASVADTAPWLEMKVGSSGSPKTIDDKGMIAEGKIEADKSEALFFTLKEPEKN